MSARERGRRDGFPRTQSFRCRTRQWIQHSMCSERDPCAPLRPQLLGNLRVDNGVEIRHATPAASEAVRRPAARQQERWLPLACWDCTLRQVLHVSRSTRLTDARLERWCGRGWCHCAYCRASAMMGWMVVSDRRGRVVELPIPGGFHRPIYNHTNHTFSP